MYKTQKTFNNVPGETYLVTVDVKSLYTNIPNSEGIAVAKRTFGKMSNKTVAAKVDVTTFLALNANPEFRF